MRNIFLSIALIIVILAVVMWYQFSKPTVIDSEYRIDGSKMQLFFSEININSRQTHELQDSVEYKRIKQEIMQHPNWDLPKEEALALIGRIERLIERHPSADYADLLDIQISLVGETLGDKGWALGLCQKFINSFPRDSRVADIEYAMELYKK